MFNDEFRKLINGIRRRYDLSSDPAHFIYAFGNEINLISFILEHSTRIYFRPTPRCELRLHARDVLVSEPKVPVVRHVHQGRAKILRHIHRSISISVTPILSKTHADRVPNSEGLVHTLYVSINRIILNGTYSSIIYSAYLER